MWCAAAFLKQVLRPWVSETATRAFASTKECFTLSVIRETAGRSPRWVGVARRAVTLAIGGVGIVLAVGGPAAASTGEIPGRGVLPDNRGYEKVSPLDKNGANALELGPRASSPDGSKFNFQIIGAPPGSVAGKEKTTLLAVRDPLTGWSGSVIDPPIPASSGVFVVTGSQFFDFSLDRSKSLINSYAKLTPDAVERALQLYLRDDATGSYQLITPRHEPPSQFQSAASPQIGGHTTDFNRVYYHTLVAQTDDAVVQDGFGFAAFNAYKWVNGQGVQLIGVLPDGSTPPGGSLVGAGGSTTSGSSERALSRDGSRAFFHTVVDNEISFSSVGGQLYVRDDHGTDATVDDTTSHVSASQRSTPDPAGPLPAIYWTAEAEHGSKVLFTSCEQLTDDSTADAASDPAGCASGANGDGLLTPLVNGHGGRDLYSYNVESGDLTDLTTSDPDGADVIGVMGASDDLSHVYFVAGGELDPSTTAEQPGGRNLYLWRNGSITFIATMDSASGSGPASDPDYLNWAPERAHVQKSHRVTPDGEQVLFMSRAPLTGYDNTNPGCGQQLGGGTPVFSGLCAELYMYDAATNNLRCVSCASNGAAVTGDARLMLDRNTGGRTSDPYARNLLEDGSRAFFQTPDALVQEDSNGKVDIYQWVGGGVGGCQNPAGCVSLISSGKSAFDSFFADASEGGHDVFFTTYERLTGADTDDFVDMYDARVDGGFPEPPSPATSCEGSACQPGPSAPSLFGSPLSAAPDGKGDVVPGRRAALSVSKLTKAQRAKLASGGSVALRVRVNRGGKVSLAARARVGRRVRLVGSSSRRVRRAGPVALEFGLSRVARAELARDGRLRVSLSVRFTGVSQPKELVLNLKPTPKGR